MTRQKDVTDAAVAFSGVTRTYGNVTAVNALTFDVRRGEMFGLIGPDGAGKTTSIRLLCGLVHANAGTIRVFDLDPVQDHRALTNRIGYLSQRFSLYGDLSIDENIAFFAEIHGMRDYGSRRDQLLDMTQLTRFRSRLADQLSGGMKQKLALACTLVHEPDIIVLDEPTTGVDPVSRREFWKLLSHFLATGITIVMSTPYLDEAERCARVALLDRGRLLALDAPAALRASLPGTLFEVVAADSRAAQRVLRQHGFAGEVFGDRVHVWTGAGDRDAAALAREAAAPGCARSPRRSRTSTSRASRRTHHDSRSTECGAGTGRSHARSRARAQRVAAACARGRSAGRPATAVDPGRGDRARSRAESSAG
jgi:ABC-2 type transport system ATP-binding protein